MIGFRPGFKQVVASAAAGVTALCAPMAQADMLTGIVDTWNVNVNAVFDTTSVVWQSNANVSASASQLTWGQGTSGPSRLTISNSPASPNANTNGAAVATIAVTHGNNPITSGTGELGQVNLLSTLTLTPVVPLAPGLAPATISFTIHFDETPNADNPCLGGGTNGVGVNINGCADIFVINQNSLNFPFFYDLDGGGSLPNQMYFISFFEETNALNALPNGACTATGVPAPCIGFRTPEGGATTFDFAALITTEPVNFASEPGGLALLGLGFAGVGLTRRRKTS